MSGSASGPPAVPVCSVLRRQMRNSVVPRNTTGADDPATAWANCVGAAESVHAALAIPLASAVDWPGEMLPPPGWTLHDTVPPGTRLPYASFTTTASDSATAVLGRAPRV